MAIDKLEQFALLGAYDSRVSVDKRNGGIRRERDGTLIHDCDFRRHILTIPNPRSMSQGWKIGEEDR
jgi:hypothetical protein